MAAVEWRVFSANGEGLHDFPSAWLDDAVRERCTLVASLRNNAITEMSPVLSCRGLVSLDLSMNQITVVPPAEAWVSLPFLSVLKLANNRISVFEDLAGLGGAHSLRVLTLEGNPVDPTSPETAAAILGAASSRPPPAR
ncbi:hypothetical protein FNF27_00984 [Cafeteria roenbergensis]|uniref:U2A'/phosphoprotein 32 family A C-terminal domain-containing protein n=1 Tax=Cafeteria roenbergensis TaxID=33653 RepID=A0A5A8DT31_CAFRO|nr:hypothetical protein FNF31_00423 [Cafeteria roenbergensis]KAA0177813.1 hypothetical protein FNF27_00984 [Cafeteria roenbergensis]